MTADDDRVEAILDALMSDALRSPDTLPQALCERCVPGLPITGAAVVLQSAAGLDRVVAANDGMARDLEHVQFELAEGPGVDASRQDGPVLQSDLAAAAGRWPLFVPAAVAAGGHAAFSFPLRVGGIRLGVMDLYRDAPGALFDGVLARALDYAAAGTAVLLHLQAQSGVSGELHPALSGYVPDRSEIHQATGMISAQAAVTLVEALLLLRARAYSADRTMLAVSRDVLARRLRFDPDDDRDAP